MNSSSFFQFNYVPYPLWRRDYPFGLKQVLKPLLADYLSVEADDNPPQSAAEMGHYLARWGLIVGESMREALSDIESQPEAEVTRSTAQPAPAPPGKVRLPAQWEPIETVLLTWPALYPPLWEQHAQMVEAIAPVASVTVFTSSPWWAKAARAYLRTRRRVNLDQVRFVVLPTDDIWVRDYGPVVGLDVHGDQVCVKLIFDPLPTYPQQQDNRMARRWAAHEELPVRALDLHLEGGNIWSDGQGTLILSVQALHSNPGLTREGLLEKLHTAFDFKKLILTPRLEGEETGHVDLLLKLADARTVLVSAASGFWNRDNLRRTRQIFEQTSNAAGQPYRVLELPTPPLYLNWLVYPVWRTYTNALTVNGRVLVPVFDIETDEAALQVYRQAMPDHDIIPIACAVGANGGGAVHCLTKELSARQVR